MPQLILIRGLPGLGKTTFACSNFPAHILVEADQFFGDPYKFNPFLLEQAHEWCLYETVRLLNNKQDVTVANTFVRLKHLKPYLNLSAHKTVYRLTGQFKSVHNVPDNTMRRMANQFQALEGEIVI